MMSSYIGRGLRRSEDPRLITGEGLFVEDLALEGYLCGAFLRSPHAHARILSIDTEKASSHPGVVAVLTAEDMAETTGAVPIPWPMPGAEMSPVGHPLLARNKVRYVGEPIALVVAETRELAHDALELVSVQYEPLPAVVDLDDAQKDQVIVHEELGTNVVFRVQSTEGDLDGPFKNAHKVVTGFYDSQRLCPTPLETRGVAASYDRSADLLTVWSSTQSPHAERDSLAATLQRDPASIRVIVPDVGGGFGQKAVLFADAASVCQAAIKLGRPVKWIERRSENLTAFHSRGATCRSEAAVARDGTILGLRFYVVCDIGAYFVGHTLTPPYQIVKRFTGPYKTPVIHVHTIGLATTKPTTAPYRGSGGPEATYFLERTIDSIAVELGLDPVEVRRKNLLSTEAFPYTTPTGLQYDSGDYSPVFEKCLKLANYDGLRREQAEARQQGRLVGLGVAAFVKGAGGGGAMLESTARLQIDSDGHVVVHTEVSPHGQGTETTFSQIIAEGLGIPPASITVGHGDSNMPDTGTGSSGSRGVIVGGSAVYHVVQEARRKVLEVASKMLGCTPDQVELAAGKATRSGQQGVSVSFIEVARRAREDGSFLGFTYSFKLPGQGVSFGTQIAQVEIDKETGEVQLQRYFGVHDCGRIINPVLVAGQIQGGIVQGIGQAMSEGILYSAEGQPLTGTLMDYAIPGATDVPDLVLDTQETPSPTNPLGTKGVGELPTVGSPVAVANAVVDALSPLGLRHLDTPYTPEKVWRAMGR